MDNPIAVSTWSLHRAMGGTYAHGPDGPSDGAASFPWGHGDLSLAALPAALKAHGYARAEICHFHLASREPTYLAEVRAAFAREGVAIQALLIDAGDVTDPVRGARDQAWIAGWIDDAALLGAENARVIAGKRRPTPETLARSVEALKALAARGREKGVRIVTENWFDLLPSPLETHAVLDAVGPELGLLADTGNWRGEGKYAGLESIFARAELCHAKSDFSDGGAMDEADAARWLGAARAAGYRGPLTLIFAGPGDEWEGLARERAFAAGHL